MGTANSRAWSHSRQTSFERCPRAYFFDYFRKGEPEEEILWLLKRMKSIPLLVGDLSHYGVSVLLRSFKMDRTSKPAVEDVVSRKYEEALAESLFASRIVREGRKAPFKASVLDLHLERGERDADMEETGRATLVGNVRAFLGSEAWEVIQGTRPSRWAPVTMDTDILPSVTASSELGFSGAMGLRVFTVFDLALPVGDEFVIVDWKTGRKTARTLKETRRQMAGYCLWALDQKNISRDSIRIQPYFLIPGEPWEPEPVADAAIDDVRQGIEAHFTAESFLLKVERRERKVRQQVFVDEEWRARREDFPPRPRPSVCAYCKFRTICPDSLAPKSCSREAEQEEAPDAVRAA